ncbi:GDSL-type esterase/lipase family protein [Bacillus sp. Marseille-P3661]|uniref:GDSL-type esterase/lipase family protein n=1 Tax=Bacillus sp. Marseille-P3661 TaxID=1936234 RepID=UPI000C863676|nr:GDSL-type esterase/lipase family protein [Bacillus sp. Marseille-P3661]
MTKYTVMSCIFLLIFVTYSRMDNSAASTKNLNIVAFGDSITHGSGDPTKQGYIQRFKFKFEEKTGFPVQMYNYGIPKYTTHDVLEQLKDETIRKQIKHANYIILYIGTNDFRKSADYEFAQLDENKMNEGRRSFSANIHAILNNLRNKNMTAPIILLGLYHPYVEYHNGKDIQGCIERWNYEILEAACEYDESVFVPTIDLFINGPKTDFFSDSLHPNSVGYELIADRLLEEVLLLEKNLD